jgi:membrane protein DedA with SNARE-associated domain
MPAATVLLASVISDLTGELDDLASNWWFIGVIFAFSLLDSIIPAVPSETSVIIGGVAAGTGEQELALVIAAAALGAFVGDNTAYAIGRRAAGRLDRRAQRRPKFATKLRWATQQIEQRGGLLLVTARFVPGGRTILTLSSGATRQPRGWFVRWIAVAAVIWATYASLLGYIGGAAFEDDHTKAFLVAFGAALLSTVLIEVIGSRRRKRREAMVAAAEVAAEAVDPNEPDRPDGRRSGRRGR